jgi:formate hydrogenlyase subunit 3/multisubunit Na+/H+ antiporter MnhD subunit
MVVGFATGLGVVSGLFYLTSHVFVAGLLFLCMGAVIFTTGKTSIDQIGGLYKYMPLTASFSAISVLAIGGLPLLSEFTGKYLIIHSTLEIGSPFFLATTILGGVFHLAIGLRLLYSVFLIKMSI